MVSHFSFQEDIEYLDRWLKELAERVETVQRISESTNVPSYFTISTTVKGDGTKPYLTPIRTLESGIISGAVVYSQTQAILAAKLLDGKVTHLLVDAEKKIGIHVDADPTILEKFGIPRPTVVKKARSNIEMGNISAAVAQAVTRSNMTEFKPNDLTVDAVWAYVSNKLRNLSGRKIAILGCGNIGFKLALKFVESGANVEMVRRDVNKGILMANAINIAKPATTLAKASFNPDPLQASVFSDVLIGVTPGIPVITWEMIQTMSPNGFILDVGKGTVEADAVRQAVEHGIEVVRSDIGPALYGFVSLKQQVQNLIENRLGRTKVAGGIHVVSGGAYGVEGDLVVDHHRDPKIVFGVCDGMGDLKKTLTTMDEANIREFKRHQGIG